MNVKDRSQVEGSLQQNINISLTISVLNKYYTGEKDIFLLIFLTQISQLLLGAQHIFTYGEYSVHDQRKAKHFGIFQTNILQLIKQKLEPK